MDDGQKKKNKKYVEAYGSKRVVETGTYETPPQLGRNPAVEESQTKTHNYSDSTSHPAHARPPSYRHVPIRPVPREVPDRDQDSQEYNRSRSRSAQYAAPTIPEPYTRHRPGDSVPRREPEIEYEQPRRPVVYLHVEHKTIPSPRHIPAFRHVDSLDRPSRSSARESRQYDYEDSPSYRTPDRRNRRPSRVDQDRDRGDNYDSMRADRDYPPEQRRAFYSPGKRKTRYPSPERDMKQRDHYPEDRRTDYPEERGVNYRTKEWVMDTSEQLSKKTSRRGKSRDIRSPERRTRDSRSSEPRKKKDYPEQRIPDPSLERRTTDYPERERKPYREKRTPDPSPERPKATARRRSPDPLTERTTRWETDGTGKIVDYPREPLEMKVLVSGRALIVAKKRYQKGQRTCVAGNYSMARIDTLKKHLEDDPKRVDISEDPKGYELAEKWLGPLPIPFPCGNESHGQVPDGEHPRYDGRGSVKSKDGMCIPGKCFPFPHFQGKDKKHENYRVPDKVKKMDGCEEGWCYPTLDGDPHVQKKIIWHECFCGCGTEVKESRCVNGLCWPRTFRLDTDSDSVDSVSDSESQLDGDDNNNPRYEYRNGGKDTGYYDDREVYSGPRSSPLRGPDEYYGSRDRYDDGYSSRMSSSRHGRTGNTRYY